MFRLLYGRVCHRADKQHRTVERLDRVEERSGQMEVEPFKLLREIRGRPHIDHRVRSRLNAVFILPPG